MARTATAPPERRAWSLIEGWADVMLKHREMLGLLRYDVSLLSRQSQYHRMFLLGERAIEVISGPDAGQRERIRALQAIAMLGDPIVYYPDADPSTLREDMLDGVRRLLAPARQGDPTPSGSSPSGPPRSGPAQRQPTRRRGRPTALTAEQVAAAQAMHESRVHSIEEIASRLGVSRATLYRHLQRADF